MGQLSLQPKFAALMTGVTSLFSTQEAHADKDRNLIEHLRAQALALAKEVLQPEFAPFIAHLLGGNEGAAQYPLQAVRMLCLAAHALQGLTDVSRQSFEDTCVAAFFADIGFRAAWLGQKGTHAELSAYRMRDMHFAWLTPNLERLILFHHESERDLSPLGLLSLIAKYLGSVYCMGVDGANEPTASSSQILEIMSNQKTLNKAGLKRFMQCLSAFPLGSWVELNNGQTGLVVRPNQANALRPTVGFYAPAKNTGEWKWEEHPLQRESSLHIVKEVLPDSLQQRFVNEPKLWIRNWEGPVTLTPTDFAGIFPQGLASSPSTRKDPPPAQELDSQSKGVRAAASSDTPPLLESPGADDELRKLRGDWERHVQAIEGSIEKLRGGLIESYRRENEHYRALFQKNGVPLPPAGFSTIAALEQSALTPLTPAQNPVPPAPAEAVPETLQPMERAIANCEAALETFSTDDHSDERRVRDVLLETREAIQSALIHSRQEALSRAVEELDRIETLLVDPLFQTPIGQEALRVWVSDARTFVEEFRTTLRKNPPEPEIDAAIKRWRNGLGLHLDGLQKAAADERRERSRRAEKALQLIKGYAALLPSPLTPP